jgi:hypothetical protein
MALVYSEDSPTSQQISGAAPAAAQPWPFGALITEARPSGIRVATTKSYDTAQLETGLGWSRVEFFVNADLAALKADLANPQFVSTNVNQATPEFITQALLPNTTYYVFCRATYDDAVV